MQYAYTILFHSPNKSFQLHADDKAHLLLR